MFISHYNGQGITLVRPLSTVENTRDYARVSHGSRQWSNYNVLQTRKDLHRSGLNNLTNYTKFTNVLCL